LFELIERDDDRRIVEKICRIRLFRCDRDSSRFRAVSIFRVRARQVRVARRQVVENVGIGAVALFSVARRLHRRVVLAQTRQLRQIVQSGKPEVGKEAGVAAGRVCVDDIDRFHRVVDTVVVVLRRYVVAFRKRTLKIGLFGKAAKNAYSRFRFIVMPGSLVPTCDYQMSVF
jgi:hypothetical protein